MSITVLEIFAVGIYAALPFLLLRLNRKWGAIAAVLALWLPIEFSLFPKLGISTTTGVVAALLAGILAFRNRPDVIKISSAFDLRKLSFRDGFLYFVGFVLIGLPAALFIGFIQPASVSPDFRAVPALVAGIFLLNALPEEILFRGIIQHAAESATKSRIGALIVASLIFGLSHLNNGSPIPNYRYFGMAALAGAFYGLAWRRNRNVLTSSVTHTLVNTAWRLFFR